MVRILSAIIFHILFCYSFVTGQPYGEFFGTGPRIFNYKLFIEAAVYECDILGNTNDSTALQVAEPGSVFTLVGKRDEEGVIIRFWEWKENPTLNHSLCYSDSLCTKRKYFLLSIKDMEDKCISRYTVRSGFTAGTVLIPIKMRLQHFDFSKDFTVGPVAGIKFRVSPYMRNYINVLAGLGITSVTLDKNSTDGKVKKRMEVPALSPSLGVVLEFNSVTQVGIFCGCDYISDNKNRNLIYHGKPWLSFGLGFTILTKESMPDEGERKQ